MFANFVKHPCTLCAKFWWGKLWWIRWVCYLPILYLAKSTQVFEFHKITRGLCPTVVFIVRDHFHMAPAKVSCGFPGSLAYGRPTVFHWLQHPSTHDSRHEWAFQQKCVHHMHNCGVKFTYVMLIDFDPREEWWENWSAKVFCYKTFKVHYICQSLLVKTY